MTKVDEKCKKKRRNHSQLGANFRAPDGGFGWFICLAAGCSNVNFLLSLKLCMIHHVYLLISALHFPCFTTIWVNI